MSAEDLLLPGEEIRVLVLDFPVAVGGREGGRGDALGLLGSVAVPGSRSSQGSPRHTGVLEGPVLYSLVLLGSRGSRGSLDAPLPVLLRRDPLLLVLLLVPAEVLLLLPLPRNCQETADFYLVVMSSMLGCGPLDLLDSRLEGLGSLGVPLANTVHNPGSRDILGTGQEVGPPGPPYSRHWTLSCPWADLH